MLERPIIIVEQLRDGPQHYLIFQEELDPQLESPASFGVLLSDLLDHIASTYLHDPAGANKPFGKSFSKSCAKNRLKDINPWRGDPRAP